MELTKKEAQALVAFAGDAPAFHMIHVEQTCAVATNGHCLVKLDRESSTLDTSVTVPRAAFDAAIKLASTKQGIVVAADRLIVGSQSVEFTPESEFPNWRAVSPNVTTAKHAACFVFNHNTSHYSTRSAARSTRSTSKWRSTPPATNSSRSNSRSTVAARIGAG